MLKTDFNTAAPIVATMNKITDIQTKIALPNTKLIISLVDSTTNQTVVTSQEIIAAISPTDSDLITDSAMVDLTSTLTSQLAAGTTALGAL